MRITHIFSSYSNPVFNLEQNFNMYSSNCVLRVHRVDYNRIIHFQGRRLKIARVRIKLELEPSDFCGPHRNHVPIPFRTIVNSDWFKVNLKHMIFSIIVLSALFVCFLLSRQLTCACLYHLGIVIKHCLLDENFIFQLYNSSIEEKNTYSCGNPCYTNTVIWNLFSAFLNIPLLKSANIPLLKSASYVFLTASSMLSHSENMRLEIWLQIVITCVNV